jgi:predicted nuclease of predicted toxin-antitoxin system
VKFLVDAQLPPTLADWLRELGYEADAVRDVGLREAHDEAIWAYAHRNGAVVLTKDEDFAVRCEQTDAGPVIVWLRIGNASNTALRIWLEPRMAGICSLLARAVA